MTASPRKTWVPGVHAHATSGRRAIAIRARPRASSGAGRRRRRPPVSDAKALPLALDRTPQVAKLRFDGAVDGLLRRLDVVANLLGDLVRRHVIEELLSALGRPPGRLCAALAGPPGTFGAVPSGESRTFEPVLAGETSPAADTGHQRRDRAAARPLAEQQRRARSDRDADQRCGKEVELLFTGFDLARVAA